VLQILAHLIFAKKPRFETIHEAMSSFLEDWGLESLYNLPIIHLVNGEVGVQAQSD
jgi:hypothetical protein